MSAEFICQQCGSTLYEDLNTNQRKCSHCGTEYKKRSDDPAVIISKGANIIIGKNANVEIKGDLEIQEGANLDIQGKVVIDDEDDIQEN
jgi:uncharacterized protein (DUF983 family)